ncbi:MAG: hypothetical protein LBD46_06630 [Endomicrobium sp.]|jgi:hypothetical protein|nr:hypothetical protein [Endomicrobium sp.]
MAEIALAKPVIRGNSDVVENFKFNGTLAEAIVAVGKAAKLIDADTVGVYDGTGTPYGVIGYAEIGGRVGVVRTAEKVGVVLDSALTIVPGSAVYITDTGTFTNVATDNTAINATFRDVAGDGINLKTGIKLTTAATAVYIDFPGGF